VDLWECVLGGEVMAAGEKGRAAGGGNRGGGFVLL
jgi:hypothetical protein